MKKLLIVMFCLGVLASCDDAPKKRSLRASSGIINTVKVVLEKEQWQGLVGDALRKVFMHLLKQQ